MIKNAFPVVPETQFAPLNPQLQIQKFVGKLPAARPRVLVQSNLVYPHEPNGARFRCGPGLAVEWQGRVVPAARKNLAMTIAQNGTISGEEWSRAERINDLRIPPVVTGFGELTVALRD